MELQLKRDRLQEVKEGIKVGDLFFDKRGEGSFESKKLRKNNIEKTILLQNIF